MTPARVVAVTVAAALALGAGVHAQRGAGPGQRTPQRAAPIDLTGYWVSLITEDWRFRAVTPPKGDVTGISLNGAGRTAANAWDPGKDAAAGEACRGYGAAGVMRLPGRLHITWQDERTLKIETDAGTQTRLIAFTAPATLPPPEWQGSSVGSWDRPSPAIGGDFFGAPPAAGGSLKVVTTALKPGYIRKNGVPYSSNAVLTEYFDRFNVPGGDSILVVSSELVDSTYLTQPFWTSTHFKRQADATGWNPTPCRAQ
ncbi:MAG TPA: hypothetical protein VL173_03125 [Vicinamibacterales bacterium]|nr:hypothetical protein [Vicinamibacterales bacterium]